MYREKNTEIKREYLLAEGTELKNRKYIIQSVIKEGTITNIYSVKEPVELGRRLLIKQLCIKTTSKIDSETDSDVLSSEMIKAFEYEKNILIILKDIFPVMDNYYVDFFEEANTPYLVFRDLGGQTLTDYVKQKYGIDSFSDSDKSELFLNILKFVDRLHKNGILHGDISPDNILIRDKKQVVLIDYGNAIISQNIRLFQKKGYSAPELYDSQWGRLGKWSDIYSVGATFCYVLSHTSLSESSISWVDDVRFLNANICFKYLISRSLQKEITKRFRSVGQMILILYLYRYRWIFIFFILCMLAYFFNLDIGRDFYDSIIPEESVLYINYDVTETTELQEMKDGIFSYIIEDEEAIIIGSDAEVTEITIPDRIGTYPVTAIRGLNKNAVSVIIPEGIIKIEKYAFRNCQYLTYIQIPASVEFIDDNAFNNCGSLKQIVISPDNQYYDVKDNKLNHK